ncbi:methyltransferase domain-containing protein [bacterium]|nr:methyltransferase domain-containing protein [bacterium]
MNRKLGPLLRGLSTYVPMVKNGGVRGTGSTDLTRYCYSVWLRYLVMAEKNGLDFSPKIVAELGPGASLGIGLAALISGCEQYYAFDIMAKANIKRNLKIFEELVELFKNKTDIPDDREFPLEKPYLQNYDFPANIFTDNRLKRILKASRLERIRNSILNHQHRNSVIRYSIPWYDENVLEKESVDMVYSQAVLEHVDDLRHVYQSMYLWLKPTGYMSHLIDFSSHGLANTWNGHWTYSDFIWKLIKGRRPYLINREPHSTHLVMLKQEGFEVICDIKNTSESCLSKKQLARRFQSIADEDLTISAAFIQAVKE